MGRSSFSPRSLGAPPQFTEWREAQLDAILRFNNSPHPTSLIVAPTGIGKTLLAWGLGAITGYRTLILTANRSLQKAYADALENAGLVSVKGQQNYPCVAIKPGGHLQQYQNVSGGGMCDDAPCHHGIQCPLVAGGCDYFDAVHIASGAEFVVTNYAFWITIGKQLRSGRTKEDPLGEFNLIVCDEAHLAADQVNSALTVELTAESVRMLLGTPLLKEKAKPKEWRKWADRAVAMLREYQSEMRGEVARMGLTSASVDSQRALRNLRESVEQLRTIDDDWVITHSTSDRGPKVVFEPIWPREACEELLFRGAERRVLMSATMQPDGLPALGLDPSEVEFTEYDSPFPLERRPVWMVDIEPRLYMKWTSPESHERLLLSRMDAFMSPRMDVGRSGLVQSVSYERARRISTQSRNSHRIVTNILTTPTWARGSKRQGQVTAEAIADFKQRSEDGEGVGFCTPSVTMGEDFPDDQCRWIAIPKLPFMNMSSSVMKARKEADPNYPNRTMAQTLQQSLGRGMRSERDWCEGAIFDASIFWFVKDYPHFLALWFRKALRHVKSIPPMLYVK